MNNGMKSTEWCAAKRTVNIARKRLIPGRAIGWSMASFGLSENNAELLSER